MWMLVVPALPMSRGHPRYFVQVVLLVYSKSFVWMAMVSYMEPRHYFQIHW